MSWLQYAALTLVAASVPVEAVNVVPGFNTSVSDYVTSYRCENCRLSTLIGIEGFLRFVQEALPKLCKFIERHQYMEFLLDEDRNLLQDCTVLRTKALKFLEEIREGKIILNL